MSRLSNWNRRGATLVELVAVIAIIGLLASVAVPRVRDVREDAIQSRNDFTAMVIYEAIERSAARGKEVPDWTSIETVCDFLESEKLVIFPFKVTSKQITLLGDQKFHVLVGTFID